MLLRIMLVFFFIKPAPLGSCLLFISRAFLRIYFLQRGPPNGLEAGQGFKGDNPPPPMKCDISVPFLKKKSVRSYLSIDVEVMSKSNK